MPERMGARLFGWFALAAVALCVVGIWGLVSYIIASQTHELGVRLAVGARPATLVLFTALRGTVSVATGCALGLTGAAAASPQLGPYLYGIGPRDPLTYVAAATFFLVISVLAAVGPSRRIYRLDPARTLRMP